MKKCDITMTIIGVILVFLTSFIFTHIAHASGPIPAPGVNQSGVVVANHFAAWAGNKLIKDGGANPLPVTPLTQGSVVFAGAAGVLSQDNANFFWDDTNNRLGLGTAAPSANLEYGSANSLAAWGLNGVRQRASAATYTDTTSSGTVANVTVDALARPTVAASSATTYTASSTLYVSNAPAAGTNVTLTNPYALWVDNGNTRLDAKLAVGGTVSPISQFTVAGNLSSTSWNSAGLAMQVAGMTLTDTSSSGTVALSTGVSFARQFFAASSATTFTDAASVYFDAQAQASTNVTITNAWNLYVSNGKNYWGGGTVTNVHEEFTGTTPAVANGAGDCGTSPAIVGNDNAGIITVGSGANGGKCTVTFATSWSNNAICQVSDSTTGVLVRPTGASATAVAFSGVVVAGDTLVYRCTSYR